MFAPSFYTLLKGRKGGFPKHTLWNPKTKYFVGKFPKDLTKEPSYFRKDVCTKFDKNR